MLGGKKDSSGSRGAKNIIPAATSHALNSIVQGASFTGDIRAESDIRVDGSVKGSLICNAKVIIGPSGVIEGEIKCTNAVIEGRFKGTLSVKELLHIKETAQIDGKVFTGKIIVQSGATFNVTCQMGSNAQANGAMKSGQEQKEIIKSTAGVTT